MGSANRSVVVVLIGAAAVGGIVGIGTAPTTAPLRSAAVAGIRDTAIASGIIRAREPQPGDSWPGCNEARGAGTAPIFRGEPGYSTDMDGDGDGIACEPSRAGSDYLSSP